MGARYIGVGIFAPIVMGRANPVFRLPFVHTHLVTEVLLSFLHLEFSALNCLSALITRYFRIMLFPIARMILKSPVLR